MKFITILSTSVLLSLFLTACFETTDTKETTEKVKSVSEDIGEVMLAAKLDDERGYCLDIAGGKGKDAPLDKGLQAHTCYSYTGEVLVDQGFDSLLITEGQFQIPYFNVCMSVLSPEVDSGLSLTTCGQSDLQKFVLQSNGLLVTQINPELCVTVSSLERKEGRGGSPVHVMRTLSLQLCDDSKKAYQTWLINRL